MSHSFKETNFGKPTYCDHCQNLLWGFVKQGVKCSDCGIVSHHDCQKEIAPCKDKKLVTNSSIYSTTDSPATKSLLRTLQKQPVGLNIQASSSKMSVNNDSASSFKKLKTIATSDEFQNVLVSAAMHSTDTTLPPNEYLANLPPLNPQNTAKNFSRFVSRCGPMFTFRDNVILLLSWNKPVDTLVALLMYCLICLHSKLALLIPHIILFRIIITGYTKRFGDDKNVNTNDITNEQKQESLPHMSTSTATTNNVGSSTNRFNFTSSLYPTASDEASPEYLKNMQNLQNMMGEMSDLYDLIASKSHYVDWSSEAVTMRVFQFALISFVFIMMLVWFIPLNIIFLIAGITLFLLNTRFAKFVLKEILPQLTEVGQTQINSILHWYTQIEKRLDEQSNVKELSLYENQRWWPESGFIPHTLSSERGLWTDMSGTIELTHKEELPAPKGYHWIEDNWTLDTTGPWIDETLEIEVAVIPENGGWVYTDNNWEYPRNGITRLNDSVIDNDHITVGRFVTRRRRWVRKCERNLADKKKINV